MSLVESLKKSVRWRYRVIPIPFSYGREFRRRFAFLHETVLYSPGQLEAFAWQRVQALVEFAYTNTEYYREQFDKIGCRPEDIRTPDDYRKLPLTNRTVVRENLDRMKPRNFESTHPIMTKTSGTTGFPLTLYRSTSHEALRRAIVWRHYNTCGYFFKDKRATLGRPLDFPQKQQFTHVDLLENNLWLNSFHLNPSDFIHIYHGLSEWKPKMIVGHPSTLYTFCLQSERNGLPPVKIPIVYSYSEKLYSHHIAKFNEYFGAEVFDYYGNRENTIAVTQMPCRSYHINSEYGYTEFVKDGKAVSIGETGSIITTSLENYSVPLIRYDTGDIGKPLGQCPNCNLPHPTMEIIGGRGKDVLVTAAGYVNCHLDTYLSRHGFKGADYIQVVQKQIDRVTVRILPNEYFDKSNDEALLKRLAHNCLSGFFEVDIEFLTEPPFTAGGKMPYVISELSKINPTD